VLAIPDGVYEAESFLDDDGMGDTPIPIHVRVIVAGDELTVDYSDMAPQVAGSINSGRFGGGLTTARVGFKYLIATGEPANEGTFRPLKMILPDGQTCQRLPDRRDGSLLVSVFPRSSIPSSKPSKRRSRRPLPARISVRSRPCD